MADGNLTRSTEWIGSVTQSVKEQTYTFSTKNKFLDKNIEFTVNADVVKTVNYTPTTSTSKDTSIRYSSVNGKYYLWR